MIKLEGLTKDFGAKRAVDSLTFEVRPGELFGFLGPNGAGKTTTLRMLATLLTPTSGSAVIAGHDLKTDAMAVKRATGYLAEQPYLYPKLSGREFIELVGSLYGVPPQDVENRRERFVKLLGLEKDQDLLAEGYSQGMKQKLGLIALLVHEPQVLLLDEPTNGLDPRAARTVKDLLTAMCARGRTVLMSTHILEVAQQMCDRVGIIYEGRLVALGTMEELRQGKDASLEEIFLEVTGGAEVQDLARVLGEEEQG